MIRQSQRGNFLFETLIVMSLFLMMLPIMYRKISNRLDETEDINIAGQMKTMRTVLEQYIDANYVVLINGGQVMLQGGAKPGYIYSALPDQGGYATVDILPLEELIDFYPRGMFNPQTQTLHKGNRMFRNYKVAIRREVRDVGAGSWERHNKIITGLIYSSDPRRGPELPDVRTARISSMIGADGGVARSSTFPPEQRGNIYGVQGAWTLDTENFFVKEGRKVPFDDAPTPGSVVAVLNYNVGDTLNDAVIYRENIPGFPDANKMKTDLDMNGWNIVNIGELDAHYIAMQGKYGKNIEFIGQRGEESSIIALWDNSAQPTGTSAGFSGTRRIVIDGGNGQIYFTAYQEVFDPRYAGQQQGYLENTLIVGGNTTDNTPRNAAGEAAYGFDSAGNSLVKDVRVHDLGGVKLSEILPKLTLVDIRRGITPDSAGKAFVPAPGFDHYTNTEPPHPQQLCPVGYAPVITLHPHSRQCDDMKLGSKTYTLDQLRCHWPHPDYLPFNSGTKLIYDVLKDNNPLSLYTASRFALGLSNTQTAAEVQPFTRTNRTETIRTFTVSPSNPNQFHDNLTFLTEGFAKVYDDVKCALVRADRTDYTNLAGRGLRIDRNCTGHGVYARFLPTDISYNTQLVDDPSSAAARKKYVNFEVCQGSSLSRVETNSQFTVLKNVYVAPECPFEEGWGFAMKHWEESKNGYDQSPFYFLRIPIEQFAKIGGHTVGAKGIGGFVASANPRNVNNSRGEMTKGWDIEVKSGQKIDAYVYCKYIPDSFIREQRR